MVGILGGLMSGIRFDKDRLPSRWRTLIEAVAL